MIALRRIGGPNAISAWSFVLTATVFLVATLLPTTRDRVTGPLEDRVLVAVLATLAAFGVLALARATILRAAARPARPWTALAVFAAAGLVQGLALVVLRPRLGLPPIEPWLLVATRAAAGVVWLSIVAILVDEVRSHHARVAELVARIDALTGLRERERGERASALATLRDETLEPLRRTLDEIGRRLADAGDAGRARAEADGLRRLVEDEVRPASHALLVREVAGDTAVAVPVLLTRRQRARIVLRLATASLAAPTWLAVGLPLVIAMLFALQGIGLAFAVVVSASWVAVMTACFAIGRRVLDSRLARMPVAAAAATLLVAYEALAVVAMANNWVWGFLSPLGRWIEWPSLFVLPALWIGIALSRAAQAKREATERRLEAAAEELAEAEARRRQLLRHEYQRVGRLLHGEVQGALLSVASRLEQAAELPAPPRAAEVEGAADQMRLLAGRIRDAPPESWTAERALVDVVDLWTGAADVRLVVDPAALGRLDAAPATRSALVDVVAEAIANAVRHGGAGTIAVRIAAVDGSRLALEVRDDGQADAPGRPGMGSRLFDDVSPAWSLVPGPGGAVLRVELVLDEARRAAPVDA